MNKILIIMFLFISLFFMACSTIVGDSCSQDTDCDTGLTCEKTFPNGYCIKNNCNKNDSSSCSVEAQCTYFPETETTYCLAKCNRNNDCRSNYTCQAVPNNEYRVCLPEE